MSPSVLVFSLVLLLFSAAPQPVRHFVKVSTSQFPRTIIEHDFCRDEEPHCWQDFLSHGSVWSGDINGDGSEELLIFPGSDFQGSAGRWYFLYEKRSKGWVSLNKDPDSPEEEEGWITLHPRFDILPAVRDRYHDLRVAPDVCLKWDGRKYVAYDSLDYRQLNPAWFNENDSHDAEIFWAMHYAGQEKMIFKPQWFPITKHDFVLLGLARSPDSASISAPRLVGVELEDPQEHLRWYALYKGGVWGVRGNQAFFLAPQVSETFESVEDLRIDGDWLLGSGIGIDDTQVPRPSIRYNRRTHELILDPHDYNPVVPDK